MKKSAKLSILFAFALGACVSSLAHQAPPIKAVASSQGPSVIHIGDAKRVGVPSGKATLTHLAKGKNAFLGKLRMNAQASVPLHRDATEEYIHILEGSGTMSIDGRDYKVGAGTTVYMPANAEVKFQNGPEELIALQVFAGPEPSAKYDNWVELKN